MIQFEDKLRASAQRIVGQDNRKMHVPQNPLTQKKTYWGWVATPAAAVAGLVLGLSMHLYLDDGQQTTDYRLQTSAPYQHASVLKHPRTDNGQRTTDTVRILQPVHDTLYLTQIVEKEKIIVRQAADTSQAESVSMQEEMDTPACTSIQCDGINYAILASN
ncbi:MAG: hypothetical protein J6P67_08125 [Bacteroidaceae bacterium]|nr:hypothetical protein [Bacteroidaceae bacterium]